mmetsp:Transcript_27992/g.80585  ORF Transcript_27992/g.80585 Transcript_27992/m.80585 type:complete len:209 (-) Transcript_27992:1021-1647(-)
MEVVSHLHGHRAVLVFTGCNQTNDRPRHGCQWMRPRPTRTTLPTHRPLSHHKQTNKAYSAPLLSRHAMRHTCVRAAVVAVHLCIYINQSDHRLEIAGKTCWVLEGDLVAAVLHNGNLDALRVLLLKTPCGRRIHPVLRTECKADLHRQLSNAFLQRTLGGECWVQQPCDDEIATRSPGVDVINVVSHSLLSVHGGRPVPQYPRQQRRT